MGRIIPVILCGGSGKRLWPLSKADRPKQFLNLIDPQTSLFQKTVERGLNLTGASLNETIIVTNEKYIDLVKTHLGRPCPHIISEKAPLNTGPAIARAAYYVSEIFSPDSLMLVMPSDHYIEDIVPLKTSLILAEKEARENRIALFGIKPHRPETGYGYIKTNSKNPLSVDGFIEKPDAATAKNLLESGQYLWNSGIFTFKASAILNDFRLHAPDILEHVENGAHIQPVSFDKAVLEKSSDLSVIPCDMQWMDVGTWEGLLEVMKNKPGYEYVEKLSASGN